MLTWLCLPARCLKCTWHFPWVSANPALCRMGSGRRNRAPEQGGAEGAPLGESPGPARTGGGNRSRVPGGAVRGRVVSLSLAQRRQTRVADGPRRVCLRTDLGEWVGLAFPGSRPRQWAAPRVPVKVERGALLEAGGCMFGRYLLNAHYAPGSLLGIQDTLQDTLEIVSIFMVFLFRREAGIQ